jgi:hypothetical protein
MLALGSWVMAMHMARRPLPSCPSIKRMPAPTSVEVYDETPSPNHVRDGERLDEGLPGMMAYTPRVPSLLTETTFWESPSYWNRPSEARSGLRACDVVWEAHHAYGEPNHVAWQPGDDEEEAAADVPMLYWDSPSEEYLPSLAAKRKVFFASQRLVKNMRKTKLSQEEEPELELPKDEMPRWSYHDATSLTPGADLSLAAKRKVFFASQRLLKNVSKELAPHHEELEAAPKNNNDATSSAEAGGSLLPIDFTLQPSSKAFSASQRLLDFMDPSRGVLDFTLRPSSGEAFFDASQRLQDMMNSRRGLHGDSK